MAPSGLLLLALVIWIGIAIYNQVRIHKLEKRIEGLEKLHPNEVKDYHDTSNT